MEDIIENKRRLLQRLKNKAVKNEIKNKTRIFATENVIT